MVSIKDVAKQAGTSFKTVSRVINNDPNVRDTTRAKVNQAIDKLGYQLNSAARTMRSTRSSIIGFLSDQLVLRPHASEILLGAQDVADAQGKTLMVINVTGDMADQERAIKTLLEHRVEGVMYACDYHREVRLSEAINQLPAILVNGYCHNQKLTALIPDEVDAARKATELLIAQGHQRIAFITPNPEVEACNLRLAGYKQALAQHGIAYTNALIEAGCVGKLGVDERFRVEQALENLFALKQPPTAIVCGQDTLAMQAYLLLPQKGFRVAEDIAIISFDNQQPIASALTPRLTTMELPHYSMGQQAMTLLLNSALNHQTQQVPFRLHEGISHTVSQRLLPARFSPVLSDMNPTI